jgi:hypothetical protein
MHKSAGAFKDWTAFGTVMLILVGTLNVSEGTLVGFARTGIGFNRDDVVFTDARTWAVATIMLGALLALTGVAVFGGRASARFVAVCLVALHAVAQLAMLQAYPQWSLLMITLDVVILFVLTVPRYPAAAANTATYSSGSVAAASAARQRAVLRRNARSDVYQPRHKAGQVTANTGPLAYPPAMPGSPVIPVSPAPAMPVSPAPAMPGSPVTWGRAVGQAPIPDFEPTVVAIAVPEVVTPVSGAPLEPIPDDTDLADIVDVAELTAPGELTAAGARPYVI